MSYAERDAWADEKALGDWPFERWQPEEFLLRPDYQYFAKWQDGIWGRQIAYRAQQAFGAGGRVRLIAVLDSAVRIIQEAVAKSEEDAYESWLKRELWLPILDERATTSENPAQMLIDSIAYVGVPEDVTEQELCASLVLWLSGEWHSYAEDNNQAGMLYCAVQAAVALAEAEFYRGFTRAGRQSKVAISGRNKIAAEKRHESNRENKSRGRMLWLSRAWPVQADAERAIAAECHITKEVAGRWVREFKRSDTQ